MLLTLSSSAFAGAPAHKADQSFGKEDINSSPVCVAADSKDQLHVPR